MQIRNNLDGMALEALIDRASSKGNFQYAETMIRIALWIDLKEYFDYRENLRYEIYLMKWEFVFNERGAVSFKNVEGFDKDNKPIRSHAHNTLANWTWHKLAFSSMQYENKLMKLCAYNIKSWYRDRVEVSPGTYMKFSEKKVVNK